MFFLRFRSFYYTIMKIELIPIKTKDIKKEWTETDKETLISLRRENQQLKKRVDELEKWLEEMLAVANTIL